METRAKVSAELGEEEIVLVRVAKRTDTIVDV